MKVKEYIEIIEYGLILDKQNNLINIKDPTIEKIVIPGCVKEVIKFPKKFEGDLIIEEGVKRVHPNTFKYCWLKSVIIPGSIKKTEHNAFSSCKCLEKVIINEGITKLDFESFSNCMKLKEIILPDSIEQINNSAFYSCPIEKLTLPKNIKRLNRDCFGALNIEEVTIPGTVEILDSPFIGCTKLKIVTLMEGVKKNKLILILVL